MNNYFELNKQKQKNEQTVHITKGIHSSALPAPGAS